LPDTAEIPAATATFLGIGFLCLLFIMWLGVIAGVLAVSAHAFPNEMPAARKTGRPMI